MNQKITVLLDETKRVLKRIGIPIVQEKSVSDEWNLFTGVVHFDNGPAEMIAVSYKPEAEYILISDKLAYPVSKEKVGDMLEIINELNTFQVGGTFYLGREAATVSVSAGFFVNDAKLDEVTFEKTLQGVMKNGENLFPIIKNFLSGGKEKRRIFEEIEHFKREGLKHAKVKK